jgi:uncharacterized protein YjbJ (UPF0337 family)
MDTDRIKGAGRDVVGRVEEGAGKLLGDTETRARGLADQAAGTLQNAYGRAKDTARDLTDQAGEIGAQARDVGSDYYNQGTRALREQVQSQPLGALVFAAAAGFLLAWMLQSRD